MAGYVGHNVPARDISKSQEQVSDWVAIKHIDCNGLELSTVEFKDGTDDVVMDDTFYEYLFVFDGVQNNAAPSDDRSFQFQVNASGQTGFNESMTGSGMIGSNGDFSGSQGAWKGTGNNFGFNNASNRYHNSTSYVNVFYNAVGGQKHTTSTGNATAGDKSHVSGELRLWHPSDATYYTPYTFTNVSEYDDSNGYGRYLYTANSCGVISVAAAIDEVEFAFITNEINGGIISMYGLAY